MSAPILRVSGSPHIRITANRIGTPAACILMTILAANQAATRSEASLPYLVQGVPQALRFAQIPTTLPPPVRPWELPPPATADPEIEKSVEKLVVDRFTAATSVQTTTTISSSGTNPNSSSPQSINPGGTVEILPDTYAPKTNVRVDDIMMFFTPPPATPSRATYEIK